MLNQPHTTNISESLAIYLVDQSVLSAQSEV